MIRTTLIAASIAIAMGSAQAQNALSVQVLNAGANSLDRRAHV
jgi:hypothetical protein